MHQIPAYGGSVPNVESTAREQRAVLRRQDGGVVELPFEERWGLEADPLSKKDVERAMGIADGLLYTQEFPEPHEFLCGEHVWHLHTRVVNNPVERGSDFRAAHLFAKQRLT